MKIRPRSLSIGIDRGGMMMITIEYAIEESASTLAS